MHSPMSIVTGTVHKWSSRFHQPVILFMPKERIGMTYASLSINFLKRFSSQLHDVLALNLRRRATLTKTSGIVNIRWAIERFPVTFLGAENFFRIHRFENGFNLKLIVIIKYLSFGMLILGTFHNVEKMCEILL